MIKVAVVGGGTMGRVHADAYRALPNAGIAAVVDADSATAGRCAEGWCAPAFDSLAAAANAVDFDLVDICLPTPAHKDCFFAAMELEKHILCEKPLARTLADCDAIISRAAGYPKKIMVAHVLRFFPEYVKAAGIIDSGAIGRPGVIRTRRAGCYPRASADWYADADSSGGPILDMVIHDFDYLRRRFGPVERVFARALTFRRLRGLDYALITLRFASGAMAHVECSWAQTPGSAFETGLEVAGDGGLLVFDSRDAAPLRFESRNPDSADCVAVPESPTAESPYQTQIRHFLDCIENDLEPSITLADALAAVEIALAALQSAQTGRVVTLPLGGGQNAC